MWDQVETRDKPVVTFTTEATHGDTEMEQTIQSRVQNKKDPFVCMCMGHSVSSSALFGPGAV